MKYTFFEIKNFKGIGHLRIDFQASPRSPIYTCVGLNESGKTTILEAINFFSYGSDSLDPLELSGYRITDVHELIPISKRANFNETIEITAGVQLDDGDLGELSEYLKRDHDVRVGEVEPEIDITERYPFKNSRHEPETKKRTWTLEITGKGGSQRKARSLQGDAWQGAVSFLRSRMPKICYFPNFLFEFPDRIYLEDPQGQNDKAKEKHRFYREVLQDILDSLGNDTTISDHILARAKSQDKNDHSSLETLLLDMSRDVTQRVFQSWTQTVGRTLGVKKVVIDHDKDEHGNWHVRFRIEDTDGWSFVSERSLGFRWFFVYLLLTLYRGYRKGSPQNLLFLFDEPASNLHSTAQTQLLKSFQKIRPNCSIIYTTHSQHLINPAWLENTFVVRNAGLEYNDNEDDYSAKKTDISITRYRKFVSDNPGKTSYFQPILDVLDYQPSKLENVPSVAMFEGKNDFYAVSYVQKIIRGDDSDLHVLPGQGAGSLGTLIQLYIAWGREFVVILDSDTEGEEQRTRYVEKFGEILRDRVFTLGDINSDWQSKGIERMFDEAERLEIQKGSYSGDSEFNKKHFNRAIQEALVSAKIVEIGAATKDRFEEILAFINDKLQGPELK